MVKRKRTKGQTTQWTNEKGQKDKTHKEQKNLSFCSFSFDHCVVCPFVLFLLTIVLFVLLSFFF
jgi:hypothetical protein